MIVYILTDGDYSNYHIIGVYSTRELADLAEKEFGGSAEEWELDTDADKLCSGRKRHTVSMRRDGDGQSNKGHYYQEPAAYFRRTNDEWILEATVWAKSDEHAIKIASEMRRQLLAADAWPHTDHNYASVPDTVNSMLTRFAVELSADVPEEE